MKTKTREARSRSRSVLGVFAMIIVLCAGVWVFGRHFFANSSSRLIQFESAPVCFGGLFVGVMVVILLHSIHEENVTRRTVANALRGRNLSTDEEFGKRSYENDLAQLAAQLRRLLADNLGCDLSGMVPSDDFEKWLYLFPGPDSAADSFFEELAIKYQLTRDCPWPERFGSFDGLIRFVAEYAVATKIR
jgi:hypothetical protein